MSLDVMYLAKNIKKLVILPLAEISEIENLSPESKKLFDVIFKTEKLGKESHGHDKQKLLSSVNELLDILTILSKYSYKYTISFYRQKTAFEFKNLTNFHGFRINGKIYQIKCGSNHCELIEIKIIEGKGYPGKAIDIRDKKELIIDEGESFISPVRINKRKSPFKLQQKLKKLKQFLESIDDDKLTILIY